MHRRNFLLGSAAVMTVLSGGAIAWLPRSGRTAHAASPGTFEITKTEDEWRAILTPEQYYVLREEGTERAFTSPLNSEKREGMFHCAGCDQAVYSSRTKYDSGTGWPSYWDAEDGAIGTKDDRSFFMVRTECHCSRCGGHLGHIFEDGPQPTGLRHCINGVAMTFKPASAATG